ncbi:DarT1-associated NADAR antitoxin family protein [Rhodoplanes serenus]|uniref:DarT1-associated NADAR antitoxin family protein n=1 Tax=Rhodoplanes serenus TaxID=200615 RepID=UPI001FDFAE1A|nr:hypothetical protein [Rhodoplanes serenus]
MVQEIAIEFAWHPGVAPSQKKKNIAALHEAAANRGLSPLLEISSKSEIELGRQLSAFNLKVRIEGRETTLECAFQGSKVFERGGPYEDIYWMDSRSARQDPRLRQSGHLRAFHLEHKEYPLSPSTAFYDWLYLNALFAQPKWIDGLQGYAGFTDIEFNPQKSLNCQARSCATVMGLFRRGVLEDATEAFEVFQSFLQPSAI